MFSRYDVYTTTQSIYCYLESNELKNKLNIRDNKQLKTAEEEITLIRQMEHLKFYSRQFYKGSSYEYL